MESPLLLSKFLLRRWRELKKTGNLSRKSPTQKLHKKVLCFSFLVVFYSYFYQSTFMLPFKNLMTPFKNLITGGESEQDEVMKDTMEPKPVPPEFVA
jgi:hypothetical protein